MKFLKLFFKKLKEIPEENKVLYAKIDELNAAVRLIIEVWIGFMRQKNQARRVDSEYVTGVN